MEKYTKPSMEVVELENDVKTGFPGLPDHGQEGNQDATQSTPNG